MAEAPEDQAVRFRRPFLPRDLKKVGKQKGELLQRDPSNKNYVLATMSQEWTGGSINTPVLLQFMVFI